MSERRRSPGARRVAAVTGGLATFPLLVLTALFFFDEWDTAAFGTLAPNIKRAFHLSTHDFGLIVVANVSIVLLLAIPVGFLGDRIPRRPLVVVGGLLAGIFSLLTGVAGSVAVLAGFRIGNGFGRLTNDTIHPSLLADYYKPEDRPLVFAFHRNGVYLGAIAGAAVAGIVTALAGWRVAFMVLVIPVVATALVALKLPEPRRGGTDDPDAAAEAEKEPPVEFREAARTLLAVPTLKRQYVAWLFIGAGLIPLSYLLPLYYERVYGISDVPRGLIVAANAAATFGGVVASGRLTRRWFAIDPGEPLKRAGLSLVGIGVGLGLVAASPWVGLAIALGLATSFVAGLFYPPFFAVQALVSPARVRSFSFSFGLLFIVGGVWGLNFLLGVSRIADDHGYRWGLGTLLPYWVIGGLVLYSAARFVAADAAKAARVLEATVAMRRQRETAGARSLLQCVGLDVAYDSVQVLFGVDLEVDDGEIVALLGTNGAGKSTLLKAISGLVSPAGGAIFFDGRDVSHLGPQESVRLGIVQMPGGRSVFPTLTVNECLRLSGWMYKRHDKAHVEAATAKVLEYFPILRDRGDQLAGNLSGGEQQMLGLAMAFIATPRLLMIDELSLGLAPTIVGQLVDIVRAIHAQGTTIIVVEQSVNIALTLAQRAVFMEKGEVRFSGATADLLERDDILRSVFLEGAASATETVTSNGKKAPARPSRRSELATDAPVVLDLYEVTRRFGGIRAVDDVTFALHQGEILGLIGPNGAGKTTVFDLISGFLVPDSGRITFGERDVTRWPPDRRARAGLGRSFQDARLFPSLTVAENIAIALERHLEVRDPIAAALGLPAVAEVEDKVAWAVHDLIELMGLGAFRNKFVGELSTGSRRIVDLAMAIAHRPTVLILDEPSSGIAQRETEALGPLLVRVRDELACSLLVIEHDMPLITGIAHTMVALELGRVIATGTPSEVVNHPDVIASYLGTDERIVARSGSVEVAAVGDAAPPASRTRTAAKAKAKAKTK
ncbi:MAG: ABC-type branched-chain amino acid transport system, ATPase component [Acidimicrobiales bacterium]|nr:ABC-type branched-chain amino acid transport system, ATPase component [Acidimicrobiales bacterium]